MIPTQVYLFIYAIMAGGTSMSGAHTYGGLHWKAQWQNAGAFVHTEACHRAAANLGLKRDEYRCIDIVKGGAS